MVREWPRQQAQTKAAMKKERPLEEKVLAEVKKRVSQIEETLKPALESSSFSSNTTKEVEKTAHAVAKVCVCVCAVGPPLWCELVQVDIFGFFVKCLHNY